MFNLLCDNLHNGNAHDLTRSLSLIGNSTLMSTQRVVISRAPVNRAPQLIITNCLPEFYSSIWDQCQNVCLIFETSQTVGWLADQTTLALYWRRCIDVDPYSAGCDIIIRWSRILVESREKISHIEKKNSRLLTSLKYGDASWALLSIR